MSSPMFAPVSLLIIVAMVILSTSIIEGGGIAIVENHSVYASPSPSTATLSGFNFAAAGDWDCDINARNTLNNILDKNPELILGLGDYVYGGDSADCWLEIVEPIDDKIKIAIGNHETGAILTELMEHFNLTDQYYSFDYQNVHFTVMSDYVSDEIGSEQYRFVQNDLAKAATDPNIDWITVSHHKNAYRSTGHSAISEAYGKWKETYHPLFEQYNVDLVLQAHYHTYQRSYPIKYNADTSSNPIITDTNTNTYTNPEGQIFLTVGTGGAFLQNLNGNKAPYLVTAQDKEFGFLNADVTNNNNDGTTTLVGTFYSNNGGEITDQFTIAKSAAGDLPLPSPPPPELPAEEETEEDAAEEEGQEEDEG
jgi:hypothetical protein